MIGRAKEIQQGIVDEFPHSSRLVTTFVFEDILCYLTNVRDHHNCGYVLYPQNEASDFIKPFDCILKFAPIHGGINWFEDNGDFVEYGFDTGHGYSDWRSLDDKWGIEEIKRMKIALDLFPKYSQRYTGWNEEGAKIIDEYRNSVEEAIDKHPDMLGKADGEFGLEAMTTIFFGDWNDEEEENDN